MNAFGPGNTGQPAFLSLGRGSEIQSETEFIEFSCFGPIGVPALPTLPMDRKNFNSQKFGISPKDTFL